MLLCSATKVLNTEAGLSPRTYDMFDVHSGSSLILQIQRMNVERAALQRQVAESSEVLIKSEALLHEISG